MSEKLEVKLGSKEETEDILKVLINRAKLIKKESNSINKELKEIKERVRIFMIDSGIDKYDKVEIRRVFSFNVEFFRLKEPELFEMYASREEVTYFKNTMTKANKDKLKKQRPEIYKEYIEEKTAQLRGL